MRKRSDTLGWPSLTTAKMAPTAETTTSDTCKAAAYMFNFKGGTVRLSFAGFSCISGYFSLLVIDESFFFSEDMGIIEDKARLCK